MTHSSPFITHSILFLPRKTYKKINMVNWKLSGCLSPNKPARITHERHPYSYYSRSHDLIVKVLKM